MEISRKTDYAIRMLAELVRSNDAVVSVRYAAERTWQSWWYETCSQST